MKLLVLGGTRDAKTLALALHNNGVEVIYSIAGLVRQPDLPCTVISGGFSSRGGLVQYITDNHITALLDATHPFATKMSQTVTAASEQLKITLWRYQRPDWIATPTDDWHFFDQWDDLLGALAPYQSIFLTQGQLTEPMLTALFRHRTNAQRFIHRTAVEPKHLAPEWMQWVQGIGPFSLEHELELIKKNQIKALVSKHSGGELPSKLLAARTLGMPVLLLSQTTTTQPSHADRAFTDIAMLVNAMMVGN